MTDAGEIKRSSVLGLVAVGIAATDLFALIAATVLQRMGKSTSELATRLGWFVFDYGFLLDVAAALLAVIAILVGGRNRGLGLVALAIVVCSFVLLFLP